MIEPNLPTARRHLYQWRDTTNRMIKKRTTRKRVRVDWPYVAKSDAHADTLATLHGEAQRGDAQARARFLDALWRSLWVELVYAMEQRRTRHHDAEDAVA